MAEGDYWNYGDYYPGDTVHNMWVDYTGDMYQSGGGGNVGGGYPVRRQRPAPLDKKLKRLGREVSRFKAQLEESEKRLAEMREQIKTADPAKREYRLLTHLIGAYESGIPILREKIERRNKKIEVLREDLRSQKKAMIISAVVIVVILVLMVHFGLILI